MKTINLNHGKVALIDDCDLELISSFNWYASFMNGSWYAINGKAEKMHRLIMGVTDPQVRVGHKDLDGLNNQRSNLRIVTRSQINMNRRKQPDTSSTFKGVCFDRSRQKWQANIMAPKTEDHRSRRGRYVYLGRYDSELEAATAYDAASMNLFGEYGRVNFE